MPSNHYLEVAEMDVVRKVRQAEVIAKCLKAKDTIVIDAAEMTPEEAKHNHPESRLHFRDRCSRCTSTLIYEDLHLSGRKVLCVLKEDGSRVPQEQTKCHPIFIPKEAIITGNLGGIVSRVIGHFLGRPVWPWMLEEVCPVCNEPPGSPGCSKVGKEVEVQGIDGKTFKTENLHSTKLK